MTNAFILNQLLNQDIKAHTHDPVIKSYKEKNRVVYLVSFLIFVGVIYLAGLIQNLIEYRQDNPYMYLLISSLAKIIIFIILGLKFKNNKKLHIALKWISLLYFYCFFLIVMIVFLVYYGDVNFTVKLFYQLQLCVMLISVMFIKIKVFFIIVAGLFNLGIIIYVQISKREIHFTSEIAIAIIIPLAVLIMRHQVNLAISTLTKEMYRNIKFSKYIEDLIFQLPCGYLIYSEGNIVHTNREVQKIISKHSVDSDDNLPDNSKKSSLDDDTERICRRNENFNLARGFLKDKFIICEDSTMESSLIVNTLERENIFSIISRMKGHQIQTGKFHYLGVIGCLNDEDSPQYNFHFRKMTTNDSSWIEIIMTDVTFSQKVKLIEKIHTIRENLLSKVAHEFKTPLLCVTSLTDEVIQDLETTHVSEAVTTKIKDINSLSNYILFLINDVVNFFNKKQGDSEPSHIELKKEKIYLTDVLKFCFGILNSLLKYQKNKFKSVTSRLDAEFEAVVFTDPFRLKQILLNLVSNAVKFTRNGSITIRMKYVNPIVIVEVEDTGMGISETDLKKLFSQEVMLTSHIKENQMGSGLGLSISHQIATQCEFKLTCESKVGVGSKFILSIPVEETDIIEGGLNTGIIPQDNISIRSNPSTVILNDFEINVNLTNLRKSNTSSPIKLIQKKKNRKILIIDDNVIILDAIEKLLTRILKKHRIDDIEIVKGYDGVDLLKEIIEDQSNGNKIILTMTDENMEYLNGNQALAILRDIETFKRMRRHFVCKTSAVKETNLKMTELYDYSINKPTTLKDLETLMGVVGILPAS